MSPHPRPLDMSEELSKARERAAKVPRTYTEGAST